ncbi:MAG TPA: hypothetical protein VMX12_05730 [Acidimicrobiia bacterium]|nr:hypothetical protein [Acidimicrobiia bacterium]
MTAPMDDRQKRAVIAVVSIFAGGIALIVLLIVLSSGGDDTKSVNTASDRTTTTSTSTTTSTLPPTTTTFAPLTVPPTAPPPTAAPTPTVIVIPPSAPATAPATAPPTAAPTAPPTTAPTTTTTQPSPSKQLASAIETALNGGVPPDSGTPKRVKVTIPDEPSERIKVEWDLDDTLTPAEQAVKAREEALVILAAIRDANLPGEQEIRILGFVVPDPDTDPGDTLRVIKLIYERATLDGPDFPTYENVFETPPALDAEINLDYVPLAPPTTSTSSTSSTTTTTT